MYVYIVLSRGGRREGQSSLKRLDDDSFRRFRLFSIMNDCF